MKISNPQTLLSKLDDETYSKIQEKFGNIERFLGPGDTFEFTCDKSGSCCKNRFDNPIILFPYDVYRLRRNLTISSETFAEKYGQEILGSESQLPMMLLDFEWRGTRKNKCPFLRSYGCKVYKDRPSVCRLYPVGRLVDADMNSYFFLTETGDSCKLGCGREYTIEQWLKEVEVEPYLDWNNRFNSLYMDIDYGKYQSLDRAQKGGFGQILFDMGITRKLMPEGLHLKLSLSKDDSLMNITYELAKRYVEKFLK